MEKFSTFDNTVTMFTKEDDHSIRVAGDAYTESCASQEVPIYQTGKTYVLSGWAKANAVPDNEEKAEGEDAAARDMHKQFGLRGIVQYADGSKEYHYVPFSPDVKEWQYASLAIVPKKTIQIDNLTNFQTKFIRCRAFIFTEEVSLNRT